MPTLKLPRSPVIDEAELALSPSQEFDTRRDNVYKLIDERQSGKFEDASASAEDFLRWAQEKVDGDNQLALAEDVINIFDEHHLKKDVAMIAAIALELREEILGENHNKVLEDYLRVSIRFFRPRELEVAANLLQTNIERCERLPGGLQTEVALKSQSQLVFTLIKLTHYDEAVTLSRELVRLWETLHQMKVHNGRDIDPNDEEKVINAKYDLSVEVFEDAEQLEISSKPRVFSKHVREACQDSVLRKKESLAPKAIKRELFLTRSDIQVLSASSYGIELKRSTDI